MPSRERKKRQANKLKYQNQKGRMVEQQGERACYDECEDINARQKCWQERNPDKVACYKKRYQEKNPEKVACNTKRWQEKNPEKVAGRKKRWRVKNSEAIACYAKDWRKRNKDKVAAIQQRCHQLKVKCLSVINWTWMALVLAA